MEELLGIIRDRNSLSGFTTFEIMQLVQNYSELVYLEEEQLLISPAYSSTCKFLIISGKVGIYEDNYENQEAISKHYLKKKMMRNEFNTRGEVQSIDRHILKQYDHKIDDDVLSDISTKEDLEVGSWFGSTSGEKNDSFVITKSFVELLMINQARLDKLRRDNYYLYQKFTNIFQIDNRTMKETMGKIGLLMIPGDDGGDNKSILSDRSHGSIAESTFNKPLIESNLMVLKNIKDLILKLHNK